MIKKVVVFGNNTLARELIEESKKSGDNFLIEACCVDNEYLESDEFYGYKMVGFSDIENVYPPSEFDMISTVFSPSGMRNRINLFRRIKEKGYFMRNYISPLANVSNNIIMGENNLIFAFANVGSNGVLGNDNFIRHNVYLGHDFNIKDGNTISPGCIISGQCSIGNRCYLGVGAVVVENIIIADETLIGAGAVVVKNTEEFTKYMGVPAKEVSKHIDTGIVIKPR